MRIDRELNVKDRVVFKHFDSVVVEIERVIDKIVAKKTKKNSRSKRVKRFVFRVVVLNSNNDDNNDNNDDDDNFFFCLRLARFNENMTTTYIANVASNNCQIVEIKKSNALKKTKLLKIIVFVKIVIERKKTTTQVKKKMKKMKKKQ